MRWLEETLLSKDEGGASSVIVAVLLVAILGFGALAVDVGAMYSEKSQLQNGADSAALAIAYDCAGKATTAPCAADQKAQAIPFANGNSVDGESNVISATVSTGVVDVITETPEKANGEHFSLYLARTLGFNSVEIQALAQATFGGIGAANVVPLAFSKCEAGLILTGGLQYFPVHGGPEVPGKAKKDPPTCPYWSSSGSELPGGFGWLDDPDANCSALVSIVADGGWVGSDSGNNFEPACAANFTAWGLALDANETVEILIPIFADYKGTGATAEFKVFAFAAISLRGWDLKGGTKTPEDYMTDDATALRKDLKLGGGDRGIYGEFVRMVSLEEAVALGGPDSYGVTGVKLTK
jgi:hypothetical protein